MRVLVMCPGSFTHGLNSPERGEGRWAQQYARMLAKAGHEVYAASGGLGDKVLDQDGCKLIDQKHPARHGSFDLYIDSSWWKDKVPMAEAKKYVCLKWAPEDYLRSDPLPDNLYVGYPYVTHRYNFSGIKFLNENRAFALPAMFCDEFRKPNWQAQSIFIPGKIDTNRPYKQYIEAISSFLNKHPVEGRSRKFFEQEFGSKINFAREGSEWTESTPYNQVVSSLEKSRISLPILNPGCVIEAACYGVPSVMWDHGGFFNTLSQQLNLNIPHDASPERFTEVAELLMNDRKVYMETVYAMQDYFSAHTFSGAIKYFNLMTSTIGLT
jgi:hypothetical protein